MTIQVTEEDIRDGRRRDSIRCAVARAASRAFKRPMIAGFSLLTPDDPGADDWMSWSLPDSAFNFIRAFDAGEPVQPFSFEVPDAC